MKLHSYPYVDLCQTIILLSLALVLTDANTNCLQSNCKNGCKIGWADQQCNYDCKVYRKNCRNFNCSLELSSGTMICNSGCVIGFYGKTCLKPCNNDTSQCPESGRENNSVNSQSCDDGLYGRNCSSKCPESHCKRCRKGDGVCVLCQGKRYGNECEIDCPVCVNETELRQYKTDTQCEKCPYNKIGPGADIHTKEYEQLISKQNTLTILIAVFCPVIMIMIVCLWLRVKSQRKFDKAVDNPDENTDEQDEEQEELREEETSFNTP